jgi:uncharacterized membrane protein YhaH (DUF805 family)
MSDENPYTTPDATLAAGEPALNQPIIFSSKGRIGRLRFLAYSSSLIILSVPLMFITSSISRATGIGIYQTGTTSSSDVFSLATGLIVGILLLVFEKRRFNDLNRSGWWILLNAVPFINFLLSIYIVFFPGTKGSNNFGPAPAKNSPRVKILALGPPTLVIIVIILAAITGNLQVVSETQ